jgi:hypothetical protein
MRWMGTYEPAADGDLMQRIRAAYAQMPGTLRKTYASDLAQLEGRAVSAIYLHRPYEKAEALRARYCTGGDLDMYDGPGD